jgi:N-alpha-acetyltransferase 15/16, NatA auxiliary subunit
MRPSLRHTPNIAVRNHLIVLELNCMTSLILEQMKRSEEAMAHQKQTLFKNLKSSVAWHVLGLLHKGHSQFEEAKKAFLQA